MAQKALILQSPIACCITSCYSTHCGSCFRRFEKGVVIRSSGFIKYCSSLCAEKDVGEYYRSGEYDLLLLLNANPYRWPRDTWPLRLALRLILALPSDSSDTLSLLLGLSFDEDTLIDDTLKRGALLMAEARCGFAGIRTVPNPVLESKVLSLIMTNYPHQDQLSVGVRCAIENGGKLLISHVEEGKGDDANDSFEVGVGDGVGDDEEEDDEDDDDGEIRNHTFTSDYRLSGTCRRCRGVVSGSCFSEEQLPTILQNQGHAQEIVPEEPKISPPPDIETPKIAAPGIETPKILELGKKEVILQSPFASCINASCYSTHCGSCFRRFEKGVVIRSSGFIKYCSSVCAERDVGDYYRSGEHDLLLLLNANSYRWRRDSWPLRLALRLILILPSDSDALSLLGLSSDEDTLIDDTLKRGALLMAEARCMFAGIRTFPNTVLETNVLSSILTNYPHQDHVSVVFRCAIENGGKLLISHVEEGKGARDDGNDSFEIKTVYEDEDDEYYEDDEDDDGAR